MIPSTAFTIQISLEPVDKTSPWSSICSKSLQVCSLERSLVDISVISITHPLPYKFIPVDKELDYLSHSPILSIFSPCSSHPQNFNSQSITKSAWVKCTKTTPPKKKPKQKKPKQTNKHKTKKTNNKKSPVF